MSEARMGNNSIDQVVHSSRAQLSLSAVESAPPDASAAATGALASTRSRSSRRSRLTATRGTARSRGTAGRSSTRTGTAKSGRSQRSAGANQRASTADLVHEVSSRFVAMLNKYLAADAASVAARVLEAADAIQVASRRGQAAMAAARGNAADSTAASEPDSPNSRAAPTPLPRTAHSATLGTTATSGSQQQQQREAASGDDASHHGRRSKPAPPRVDFDIIAGTCHLNSGVVAEQGCDPPSLAHCMCSRPHIPTVCIACIQERQARRLAGSLVPVRLGTARDAALHRIEQPR